jgi:hypothetical protein
VLGDRATQYYFIVLLDSYHPLVERRFARQNDQKSYAGGSVSSWKGQASQTGKRVGVRQSVVPGSPGWGGRMDNDPTPEKFTVTKPWRKPRPTQDCSPSKDDKLTVVVLKNIKRITMSLQHEIFGLLTVVGE